MKNRWGIQVKSYKVFQGFLFCPLLFEDSFSHLQARGLVWLPVSDAINSSSSRLSLGCALLPCRNRASFHFFALFFITTSSTSISVMITENLCYTMTSSLIWPYFLALGSAPGTWSPDQAPLLFTTSKGHPLPSSKCLHPYVKIGLFPAHFRITWHRGKVSF